MCPAAADVGAVVAFGQILRPPLLGAYPLFNLHPSLLPRWRGAAPIERALMAGDAETGVAVIELVAELDARARSTRSSGSRSGRTTTPAPWRRRARPGRAAAGGGPARRDDRPAPGRRGHVCRQDRARRPSHRLARPGGHDHEPGARRSRPTSAPEPSSTAARSRCGRRTKPSRPPFRCQAPQRLGAQSRCRLRAEWGRSRCSSCSRPGSGGWRWASICAACARRRRGRHERPPGRLRGGAADVRGGRLRRPGLPARGRQGEAGRARPPPRDAPGLRHGPARSHARLRHGGARVAPARAAPADLAGGAAAGRLPDPVRGRHPRPGRGQRDGRAGQGRRGPAHRRPRQRRPAPGRRGGGGVGRDAPARPAPLLSRLDRRRVDGDAGRVRGRGADGRPERAARALRAGEHAPRRPARPGRPRPRRSRAARGARARWALRRGREPPAGRRRHLAAVARLDAGGAPARPRAGDARARPVLGARRQGRAAGGAHGRSRPAGVRRAPPRPRGRARADARAAGRDLCNGRGGRRARVLRGRL